MKDCVFAAARVEYARLYGLRPAVVPPPPPPPPPTATRGGVDAALVARGPDVRAKGGRMKKVGRSLTKGRGKGKAKLVQLEDGSGEEDEGTGESYGIDTAECRSETEEGAEGLSEEEGKEPAVHDDTDASGGEASGGNTDGDDENGVSCLAGTAGPGSGALAVRMREIIRAPAFVSWVHGLRQRGLEQPSMAPGASRGLGGGERAETRRAGGTIGGGPGLARRDPFNFFVASRQIVSRGEMVK